MPFPAIYVETFIIQARGDGEGKTFIFSPHIAKSGKKLNVTLGILYHGEKSFAGECRRSPHHREITILTAKLAECR
jgi:ABC-type uncharacterized transport system ATPase subunit